MNIYNFLTQAPRWCLVTVLCLSSFALVGCDGESAPTAADQDKARETLDRALTAWQKGETVDAMKNSSPAITVNDPKWTAGKPLVKFDVEGVGKPSGAERLFTVNLWFAKDKGGKEVREQVVYRVGTHPILSVFRSLF